jgi:DNA-directed RNA polymerase specialized sigma24 family protein
MKHSEIAELVGITEGTSKSQLARARAWARAELTETDERRA